MNFFKGKMALKLGEKVGVFFPFTKGLPNIPLIGGLSAVGQATVDLLGYKKRPETTGPYP